MENSTENHSHTHKERPGYIAAIPNVFAYVASTVAGGFITDREVKRICYEKLKKEGAFDAIAIPRRSERLDRWKEQLNTPERRPGSLFREIGQGYDHAKTAEFEKRGFKRFRDYAGMLSNNDRIDAAERVFTVTGIVLGALITIANSKPVAKLFSGENAKDDAQGR